MTRLAPGCIWAARGWLCVDEGNCLPLPRQEVTPVLTLVSCPECDVPAEVTDRFTLPSTEGPVAHVAVSCAAGHHFRMPSELLSRRPRRGLTLEAK